jgi:hypothetical protein
MEKMIYFDPFHLGVYGLLWDYQQHHVKNHACQQQAAVHDQADH